MERRDYLKTAGGIGVGTAVGGLGVLALTGSATAANANLEGVDPSAVTTDDGSITYVSYGGRLRFAWDGLDAEATHGGYEVYSRVQRDNGSWSSWVTHGSDSGALDGNWGGDNDDTDQTGTEGFFEFKFGERHNQQDYAIAYDESDGDGDGNPDALDTDGDGTLDARPVLNPYGTSRFEADEDGGQNRTKVDIRKVCAVYDGAPGDSATQKLIEAGDEARFEVVVNNREATATTGGEVEGNVEADES